MVNVVSITTKERKLRSYHRLDPAAGGVTQTSYIICDQGRTISKERLGKKYGAVSRAVLAEVEIRLKFLLDFT